MRQIPLGHDRFAVVDDADFDALNAYRWSFSCGYAYRKLRLGEPGRRSKRDGISMHRQIMGQAPLGKEVDHVNRDKLDNRRQNLRFVSRAENIANTGLRSTNRSGVKGVSWDSSRGLWRASITVAGRHYSTRTASFEEAVVARVKMLGR